MDSATEKLMKQLSIYFHLTNFIESNNNPFQ